MGNVLGGGTIVLLGDQSDADAVRLLGVDSEQHGLGCQMLDASRRIGLRGEVFERRATLGGPSKQLGGRLEGRSDAEEVGRPWCSTLCWSRRRTIAIVLE